MWHRDCINLERGLVELAIPTFSLNYTAAHWTLFSGEKPLQQFEQLVTLSVDPHWRFSDLIVYEDGLRKILYPFQSQFNIDVPPKFFTKEKKLWDITYIEVSQFAIFSFGHQIEDGTDLGRNKPRAEV